MARKSRRRESKFVKLDHLGRTSAIRKALLSALEAEAITLKTELRALEGRGRGTRKPRLSKRDEGKRARLSRSIVWTKAKILLVRRAVWAVSPETRDRIILLRAFPRSPSVLAYS
ncbi:MAG: hypothetical protein G01um101449_557 [Parcubacteria group bacterium Gr01-1014_49]|nr:MAG: hypothetical protein G01um101449_557 [Parcubacteria group bacterium Gr01-1014_49]